MKVNMDYNVPSVYELREMYVVPYRFSEELRTFVIRLFEHPRHNARHRDLFTSLMRETDPNDMLKGAYLIYKYYQQYPQRCGGELHNLLPIIFSRMWKAFLSLHKGKRGVVFPRYLPTSMKLMGMGEVFLDKLEAEVLESKFIGSADEMCKPARSGNGGRVKEKVMQYYDTL